MAQGWGDRTHPHQTGCSRLLADPGPLRGQLMSSCLGPGRGCSLSGQASLPDRALVRPLFGDWDNRRGARRGDKETPWSEPYVGQPAGLEEVVDADRGSGGGPAWRVGDGLTGRELGA